MYSRVKLILHVNCRFFNMLFFSCYFLVAAVMSAVLAFTVPDAWVLWLPVALVCIFISLRGFRMFVRSKGGNI